MPDVVGVLRFEEDRPLPEPGRWGDEWKAPLMADYFCLSSDVFVKRLKYSRTLGTIKVLCWLRVCMLLAANRADVDAGSACCCWRRRVVERRQSIGLRELSGWADVERAECVCSLSRKGSGMA